MRIFIAKDISYIVLAVASIAFSNSVAAFSWQVNSSLYGATMGHASTSFSGNVLTLGDSATENLTSDSLPAVNIVSQYLWIFVDNNPLNLAPENMVPMSDWRDGGWYTDNFNGTGVSLSVHLTGLDFSYVRMGDIADATGEHPLLLDSRFYSSFPLETRTADDLVPVKHLGAFGPHEVKHGNDSFITYDWGDGRLGDVALYATFGVDFISPIPEPETYVMLLAGLVLIGFIAGRRKVAGL